MNAVAEQVALQGTHVPNPLTIDGWMSPKELQRLMELAEGRSVIEVGSYKGRSAAAMALSAAVVYCIDRFGDEVDLGREDGYGTQRGEYESAFRANLAPHIASGKVVVLKGDAHERLTTFPYSIVDMIFIDASHHEADVRRDIADALPLLRRGGVLCGHDYPLQWGWPDVQKVVTEMCPGHRNNVDSIWEWTKP